MHGRKTNGLFETPGEILRGLNILPAWGETRGPKPKYFFHHLRPGQIERKTVSLNRARSIQTSIKQAANRQGYDITIQNHGTYLLIKRNK